LPQLSEGKEEISEPKILMVKQICCHTHQELNSNPFSSITETGFEPIYMYDYPHPVFSAETIFRLKSLKILCRNYKALLNIFFKAIFTVLYIVHIIPQ